MRRKLIRAKIQFPVNSPHRQQFPSIHLGVQAGASGNKNVSSGTYKISHYYIHALELVRSAVWVFIKLAGIDLRDNGLERQYPSLEEAIFLT